MKTDRQADKQPTGRQTDECKDFHMYEQTDVYAPGLETCKQKFVFERVLDYRDFSCVEHVTYPHNRRACVLAECP